MKKMAIPLLAALCWLPLHAESHVNLQFLGVEVEHKGTLQYVKRIRPKICRKISIEPDTIWGGNFSSPDIPAACKGDLVKTAGKIMPMHLDDETETYGELEVLAFMERADEFPEKYLLVDSRGEEWYDHETIPSAVSISYRYLVKPDFDMKAFHRALKTMGVVQKGNAYDFTKAKTLLFFCNGPWCTQSPRAIDAVRRIGYPPEKIKWYRGGMHDWKSLGMVTTKE